MSVETSFHAYHDGIPHVRASSVRTAGAPLSITIGDIHKGGCGRVCIFTGNQAYTDALIAAINSVAVPIDTAA